LQESPVDRFEEMRVFAAVVDAQGFSRAAERIGLSRVSISKHIAHLEERLGVRLLNRTTRQVSVTEAGAGFHQHCRRILSEVEEAERSATTRHREPVGELRVVAPINFGLADLGRAITDLLISHPMLQIDLSLNDRVIDPIEAGFDVAIRVGRPEDVISANLVVCPITTSKRILCASPEYLQQRGIPRQPQDLENHACLSYSYVDEPHLWRFRRDDAEIVVKVSGPIVTSAGGVLSTAAVRGLGVAYGPMHFFQDELETGRLRRVLEDFELPHVTIYGVYPATRFPAAKILAFFDFMTRYFERTR
jgi:DNA-binding transcriptional LysR family regulator